MVDVAEYQSNISINTDVLCDMSVCWWRRYVGAGSHVVFNVGKISGMVSEGVTR